MFDAIAEAGRHEVLRSRRIPKVFSNGTLSRLWSGLVKRSLGRSEQGGTFDLDSVRLTGAVAEEPGSKAEINGCQILHTEVVVLAAPVVGRPACVAGRWRSRCGKVILVATEA